MGGMGRDMSREYSAINEEDKKANIADHTIQYLFEELYKYVRADLNMTKNDDSCTYRGVWLAEASLSDKLQTKGGLAKLRNILSDIQAHPFFEDNVEDNKDMLETIDEFIKLIDKYILNMRLYDITRIIPLIEKMCVTDIGVKAKGGKRRKTKNNRKHKSSRSTKYSRTRKHRRSRK
jgi:hypothetical protein